MTKYHINLEGKVTVCNAEAGHCPFGAEYNFNSFDEAQEEADRRFGEDEYWAVKRKAVFEEQERLQEEKDSNKKLKAWEVFEIERTAVLNAKYGKYAKFIRRGGSDATVPDIHVVMENGRESELEVKKPPAQGGQFVLIPDEENEEFIFSEKNQSSINEEVSAIIEVMNKSFKEFNEAGTKGKDIPLNDEVFYKWVKDSYKNKGVQFFVTKDDLIVPVDELEKYFDINAKYREKRSGSGNTGEENFDKVKDHLNKSDYPIDSISTKGSKMFVTSKENLHNQRFVKDGWEYMFSNRGKGKYEIRRLSNTSNSNVIFSLKLKKNNTENGVSDQEFVKFLKGGLTQQQKKRVDKLNKEVALQSKGIQKYLDNPTKEGLRKARVLAIARERNNRELQLIDPSTKPYNTRPSSYHYHPKEIENSDRERTVESVENLLGVKLTDKEKNASGEDLHKILKNKLKDNPPDLEDVYVVDIETSNLGFSDVPSSIIEVGYVKLDKDGNIKEERSELYSPQPEITRMIGNGWVEGHGITEQMNKGKPVFEDARDELAKRIPSGSTVIAHNAPYEKLHFDAPDANLKFNYIDTRLLNRYFPKDETRGNSLKDFAETHGITYENAHRAVEDCKMTRDALMKFLEEQKE